MASSGEYFDADRPAGVVATAAPSSAPASLGGGFNLSSIRAFFWRQRFILIGVTTLVFLAGLIYTLLTPPTYTAIATMRIDASEGILIPGQEVTDPGVAPRDADRFVRSLFSIMSSRNMAFRVVDELGLQDNPAIIGEDFEGAQDESTEELRRQIAAGVVNSNMGINIPMNSDVVLVQFVSGDPVIAARIANAYVDTFMEDSARQGQGSNSYSISYLEEQIQEVRGRLLAAERSALAYARENRIVSEPIAGPAPLDPTTQTGTTSPVAVSNLASVNQTYTAARAARIAAEQVWQAAANVPAIQLPMVQQNGTVQALRSRQTTLEATRSDLQQRYRDDYPQIRELNAQIEEIGTQITQASAEIKNGIRENYLIALRQEQALGAELERVSTATLDEQDRRVQYNIMDRDAQALRGQLAALLGRYNQITSAANLQSQNVSWLDRATVPVEPTSPNLLFNLFMSFLLGAALATAIAVLREMMDDRVRTADELERKLGLPALGRTPYVSEEIPEEIEDPFSPISEAYASIRATLDHAVRREHSVIQLTSSEAGEGKTTSAVALARKYASTGRKVLLVDFDLRRPGLSKMFGDARPEAGVVDVLYSRLPLERALLANATENLDILPVGALPDNPVEVMPRV